MPTLIDTRQSRNRAALSNIGSGTDATLDSILGLIDSSVGSSSTSSAQDRSLKMIKGGTWEWDLATTTLSLSADAYIQIPSLEDQRNTISAQSISLTADGQVAYVQLTRTGTGANILTVSVGLISALTLTDNIFIIARRTNNEINIGNAFTLKDGELLELDGALAEINRYFGQLQLREHLTNKKRVTVTSADITKLDGTILSQAIKNLVLSFNGAEIDFSTGSIYESDGTTPLGIDFTLFDFTAKADEYYYYSVTLLASTVNADNTINGQLLIIGATDSDAVLANAQKAAFGNGLQLGQVVVQNDSATSVTAVEDIAQVNIKQLGVGGGSGGGAGDASVFTYRVEDRLISSYWEYVTPIVFSTDEDSLIDVSSTATYDIPNGVYNFENIGDILLSKNLFDAQFLAENVEVKAIELHTKWLDDATLDEAATVEVALDGTNYQTITMERLGQSSKMISLGATGNERVEMDDPISISLLSDITETGSITFDATHEQIGIKFSILAGEKAKVTAVLAKLNKLGAPLGNLRANILNDNGSGTAPGTEILYSSAFEPVAGIAIGDFDYSNDSGKILTEGDYWFVVEVDTDYLASTDGSNKISWRTNVNYDSVGYNGTIWSAQVGIGPAMTISGWEYDLRLRITSSAIDRSLEAIALFYAEELDQAVTGYKEQQVFQFSGDLNKTQFEITNFLPNPETMLALDINTGQVYSYPAFSIDGRFINFPSGMFNIAGENVIVKFIQYHGSYDNSDSNANLLATNHLGSSDTSLDKSIAGRGIILRQETNSILKEVALDENGFIQILSV